MPDRGTNNEAPPPSKMPLQRLPPQSGGLPAPPVGVPLVSDNGTNKEMVPPPNAPPQYLPPPSVGPPAPPPGAPRVPNGESGKHVVPIVKERGINTARTSPSNSWQPSQVQQNGASTPPHRNGTRPTPAQPARQGSPQSPEPVWAQGATLPCPTTGWQYVDPKKNIQGPFTLLEMQHWNSKGYFRPDLPMRCHPSDPFISFKELFPHPLVPFQSYPKRPTPTNSTR